jgi:DNA polymerase V
MRKKQAEACCHCQQVLKISSTPDMNTTQRNRIMQRVGIRIIDNRTLVLYDVTTFCKLIAMPHSLHKTIIAPALGQQPAHTPLYGHKVEAGFPSPADDYIEGRLSLDEHLIQHRDATFFVRAKGNSMIGAGIYDGDLLVVDRSLTPSSGDIVIAVLDAELTVKRLIKRDGSVLLKPENPGFKEIVLKDGQELQVWGVVTSATKKFI